MFLRNHKSFLRHLAPAFLTFPLIFGIFLFSRPAFASVDLSNLAISKNYESSTKYFYNYPQPWVSGNISSQVKSVLVYFDNISNNNDYFVAISNPVSSFSTAGKCFSPSRGYCLDDITDGNYRVSVEAFRDLDVSEVYTFPKLLVKIPTGSSIDKISPAAPILDAVSSPIDADSVIISGSAEANSFITLSGSNQTKTLQLSAGNNRFSINVSLTQNSNNTFSVTAMDDSGNISNSAQIGISEVTPAAVQQLTTLPITELLITNKVVKKTVLANNIPTVDNSAVAQIITPAPTPSNSNNQPADSGSVKGESTKTNNSPSKTLLVILYISIGLLIIAWGLYFGKIFFRHRAKR